MSEIWEPELPAVVTEGFDVENDGDDEECKESDHVGPDVARFCMNPEDGLEALGGALELRPVPEVQVLVVLHPFRQMHKVLGLSNNSFFE